MISGEQQCPLLIVIKIDNLFFARQGERRYKNNDTFNFIFIFIMFFKKQRSNSIRDRKHRYFHNDL